MIRSFAFVACVVALALSGSRAIAQGGSERALTGPLTLEQLLDLPGWFGEEFMTWMPNMAVAAQLPPKLEGVRMVCVLGTWCSDSRREVPRLLRLLQLLRVDPSLLTLYGVDRSKRSPEGEEHRWGITLVPTIIVLRGDTELGRIVESPARSLEADLLGILDPSTLPAPAPPDQTPPQDAQGEHHPDEGRPVEHTNPDGSTSGGGDADRIPADLGAPSDAGGTPPAPVGKPSAEPATPGAKAPRAKKK